MSIIVLQHSPVDGPGRLAPLLTDLGHKLDVRRLDLAGAVALPPDYDEVHAVIVLGGPQNVGDGSPFLEAEMAFIAGAHARQLPLLGICLGHQLIANALGGEVGPAALPELGMITVKQLVPGNTDVLLAGTPWTVPVFASHAQEVTKLPPDATALQMSKDCKVQSFRVGLRTYGFQYHFETLPVEMTAHLRTPFAQQLMGTLGLDAARVMRDGEQHADAARRLGDRLTSNFASFMFPMLQKSRR
ncbi:hypothetical protein BH11PLA1_BH11PLA1_16510 [soil metagenome]